MAEVKKPTAVPKKAEEAKADVAAETKTEAAKKTTAAAKKAAAPKKTTAAAKKAAAPKKEAAPKGARKAAAPKKEAAPKAAKKAAEVAVKIQFNGNEVDLDWLKAEVANKAGDGAVAYFNANEGKVYCTVNGEAKCDFEV